MLPYPVVCLYWALLQGARIYFCNTINVHVLRTEGQGITEEISVLMPGMQ